MVEVICYGQREKWNSRDEAIKFFFEGMMCCEGSERERYTNIYVDLLNGNAVCTDGYPERK